MFVGADAGTFYKCGLEYRANDDLALSYLRSINAAYLSDTVKARIAELDGGESTLSKIRLP